MNDDFKINGYESIYDKFLWFDTHYPSRYPSFLFESSIRPFMDERNIFFDNDLLDLHLKMPFKLRSNSWLWKKALAMIDPKICFIKNANTNFSPFMPDFIEWGIMF
jgi:hypothetical protein